MTVYLPEWHSHCTRARFTAVVSCSDDLAVHSCPLLACRDWLRNMPTDFSAFGLYCVTI